MYLGSTILCDALRYRTMWLLGWPVHFAAIFATALAIKVIMLILETRPKRSGLVPKWQHASPEATSGIINRAFFWWANSFLIHGFRNSIDLSTLYSLDHHLSSEPLLNRLQVQWRLHKGKGKYPLFWALLSSIRKGMAAVVGPQICVIIFTLLQPVLISQVIQFIGRDRIPEDKAEGYALIAATAFVYTGIAVCFDSQKKKPYLTTAATDNTAIDF